MCLGSVGTALHHKLCHTLSGTFGLPHAATHAVVLPHVMAYNAAAVPDVMGALAAAMNVDDAPGGVWHLVARLGAPTSLASLGLSVDDLGEGAEIATTASYPNPRRSRGPASGHCWRAHGRGTAQEHRCRNCGGIS